MHGFAYILSLHFLLIPRTASGYPVGAVYPYDTHRFLKIGSDFYEREWILLLLGLGLLARSSESIDASSPSIGKKIPLSSLSPYKAMLGQECVLCSIPVSLLRHTKSSAEPRKQKIKGSRQLRGFCKQALLRSCY